MGVKSIMKTILDPIGSLVGESIFDDKGSSASAPEQSDEDKERDRRNGVRQGIRDAAFDKENNLTWDSGYKRGGRVKKKTRGSGIATQGTRKAKIR